MNDMQLDVFTSSLQMTNQQLSCRMNACIFVIDAVQSQKRVQGSHSHGKSWKTMENDKIKSRPGKVMENDNFTKSHGNVMEF